jgi:hypothetical protein
MPVIGSDEAVWLVSFSDDDDRELTPSAIAEALVRGEIDVDTIVWREGLPDWVQLSTVPSLSRLIPSSGETATAPLAAPIPSPPAAMAPARESADDEPTFVNAEPARAEAERPAAPKPTEPRAPFAKGTTKIGIPKVEPVRPALQRLSDGTPLPLKGISPATQTPLPGARPAGERTLPKPGATPLPVKAAAERLAAAKSGAPIATKTEAPQPSPRAPTAKSTTSVSAKPDAGARKDPTPSPKATAPTAPKAATPSTPKAAPKAPSPRGASSTETPVPYRARANSNPDIWKTQDESDEAEPISIVPEPVRPPSPTEARAIRRAKALSPGILAVKKPPAPPAPREKRPVKETPPPVAAPVELASPAANELAALFPTRTVDDYEALLSVSKAEAPPLGAPTIDVASLMGPPETSEKSETPLLVSPLLEPPTTEDEATYDVPLVEETDPTETESNAKTVPLAEARLAPIAVPAAARAPTAPRATAAVASTISKAPPPTEKKRAPLMPLVFVALGLLALAFLMFRPSSAPQEPTAEVKPEAPPTATAEPTAIKPTPSAPATEAPAASAMPSAPPAAMPPNAAATNAAPSDHPKASAPSTATAIVATKSATAPAAEAPAKTTAEKAPGTPTSMKAQPEVNVDADFDRSAAAAALGASARQASSCRKPGDPSGVATVHVTFSNAGRATRAVIEGPPFAGTSTGGCIAEILRKAQVPPYGGERVTVTKHVVIE